MRRHCLALLPVIAAALVAGAVLGFPWVAMVTAAEHDAPGPTASTIAFGWPLPGTPTVVRTFDPPGEPWLSGHRGVDLAGTQGEIVDAAGAGTVAYAGTIAGVGVVSIAHTGGLRTTYEPVRPSVRAGAHVVRGQPIGTLLAGHPGCPPAVPACLHWGLLRGSTYLDPLLLLRLGDVRLLPT